jgi:hypothetical protein
MRSGQYADAVPHLPPRPDVGTKAPAIGYFRRWNRYRHASQRQGVIPQ